MKHERVMSDLQRLEDEKNEVTAEFNELAKESFFYWYVSVVQGTTALWDGHLCLSLSLDCGVYGSGPSLSAS